MIRVWGGGIYEADKFYSLCDELGILVWQDFVFGCGNYPCFHSILQSIEQEATAAVRRLRHHPSIAVFAGNNEDYQVQESFSLTYNPSDTDPSSWLTTDFPARYIYESLLPSIIAVEAPTIPYHPGSPWSPSGLSTSDPTVGDLHQWNVWHGTQEKYQIFDTLGGRFNSEFGMEALPHLPTIKHFCSDQDEAETHPQSRTLYFHNKADGHERRIATYLVENFRCVTALDAYVHLTQLAQAEALMFGYRGWRRQWGEGGRRCGGALVWQLNDCWPGTSWSIVDYFGRRKMAWYALRRVLGSVAVGVKREHHDWSVVHARPAGRLAWECWVVSSLMREVEAVVEVRFVSIDTGKDIKPALRKEGVRVAPNGTMVFDGMIDNGVEEPHVLTARIWLDGELAVAARDTDWPQPFKYLDFKDRGVVAKASGSEIRVTAQKPTKGLMLEERDGVKLSDSGIDVVPGDEQVVHVQGMKDGDEPLGYRWLGM